MLDQLGNYNKYKTQGWFMYFNSSSRLKRSTLNREEKNAIKNKMLLIKRF